MSLQASAIRPWRSWNWSGDEIVHKPIIPACRTIPGTRRRYQIDIREFLTTTNNAVVGEALSGLIHSLPANEQALFRSHSRGSFDFRVDQVVGFVGGLRYRRAANVVKSCPDAWLFPDETLTQGAGDCEDLAFLLAALLGAAGVSNYCLRVVLGTLQIQPPHGKALTHDHCWVMYLNEAGGWEILEPLAMVAAPAPRAPKPVAAGTGSIEYLPRYVFNADHLWLVRSPGAAAGQGFAAYCGDRRFWGRFDPSFAASIHATIFDKALSGLAPASGLAAIKRQSLLLDANLFAYDPRDHFDSAYVAESWARVGERLTQFQRDNTDWGSFGAAGHAIADFYAHSSYVHFARLQNAATAGGQAMRYEPGGMLAARPSYLPGSAGPELPPFDLTSAAFSLNPNLWPGTKAEAAARWSGQLISGRYAQRGDPKATFFEGLTGLPLELVNAPGYARRGALPHHDEIAVDAEVPGKRHQLYRPTATGPDDRQAYANQYRWRVNTAIQHVRQAFAERWHG